MLKKSLQREAFVELDSKYTSGEVPPLPVSRSVEVLLKLEFRRLGHQGRGKLPKHPDSTEWRQPSNS
jgi:hypothetical protein